MSFKQEEPNVERTNYLSNVWILIQKYRPARIRMQTFCNDKTVQIGWKIKDSIALSKVNKTYLKIQWMHSILKF